MTNESYIFNGCKMNKMHFWENFVGKNLHSRPEKNTNKIMTAKMQYNHNKMYIYIYVCVDVEKT